MAIWPFSKVWPGSLAHNQVPTHSELNKLDEQQAQAADGSWWTDVAQFANFPTRFTNSNGGRCALYNPVLDRFFSFNDSSGSSNAVVARNPFLTLTSPTIPSGITSVDCAVDPVSGRMVVVGAPVSSSQARVLSSSNGTAWTARNTALAA